MADPVFRIWSDPNPVLKIWSDPDPVLKIWSDPDPVLKIWSDPTTGFGSDHILKTGSATLPHGLIRTQIPSRFNN